MSRRINSPGIEINEIDRSSYDRYTDGSSVGTLAMVLGFSDKGQEEEVTWINNMNTFSVMYGTPTTEAERYFYNAAKEIIDQGGLVVGARLPYDNNSKDMYSYVDWSVSEELTETNEMTSDVVSNVLFNSNITSFIEISSTVGFGSIHRDELDNLLVNRRKLGLNRIRVVDKKRTRYEVFDSQKQTLNNEIVGILPVLVTPVNAMYYQGILRGDISGDYITDRIDSFCPVSRIHTTPTVGFTKSGESMGEFYDKCFTDGVDGDTKYDTPDEEFNGFLVPIGTESDERWCLENINSQSLSKMASDMFPTIRQNEDDYDSRYLKDVGLVVFRMFFDRSNDNKISFIPAESFIGSLDPEHVDPITGASDFIDTVVNDNSEYVYIFSNIDIEKRGEPLKDFTKSQTLYIGNQHAISLGFHQSDSKKTISYKNSILDPIQRIFDNHQDYTNLDIDIMIDAGMSTIAQSIVNSARTLSGDAYPETAVFFEVEDGKNPIMSSTELGAWRSVVMKYDNFCKYVRKDCIYLCDSPRAMVLEGPQKRVRPTKPGVTIKNTILPQVKYISGVLNSSYSAGYMNWFRCPDGSSGQLMWIPPSIKAAGKYIFTDLTYLPWNAPAGMRRGVVGDAVDVSFNPDRTESDTIYIHGWNYAVSYPLDGIVIEGQKTFQADKTALDRVNVRRLMLTIEKTTRDYARRFNYEQNTPVLRQRFTDTINNFLEQVKIGDGISEYLVVCDERNNTDETIDNNELHVTVAVKPIKAIEYIVLNFVCTNQSANVEEMAISNM